jgi:hypothetical protein
MAASNEVEIISRYIEFGYEDGRSLVAERGKARYGDKKAVLAYLAQGKLRIASPGVIPDPFAPGKLSDSYSILTDGHFAWHQALGYFVDHYDIPLPAEFLEHMSKNRFQVPTNINVREIKLRF